MVIDFPPALAFVEVMLRMAPESGAPTGDGGSGHLVRVLMDATTVYVGQIDTLCIPICRPRSQARRPFDV